MLFILLLQGSLQDFSSMDDVGGSLVLWLPVPVEWVRRSMIKLSVLAQIQLS